MITKVKKRRMLMLYFPEVKVAGQQMAAPGCYRLILSSVELSRLVRPGQFLHVRVLPLSDPLLRRPFSVHAVDRQAGRVSLLYRVVGRGTALLARKKEGDCLDVIGPLGRGFSLPAGKQAVAIVAGGIGIAPLFFLLQEMAGENNPERILYILLGARTAEELLLIEEIKELTGSVTGKFNVLVATDDGSCGHRGPVTELLERLLTGRMADMVYACGPQGMLRAVSMLLEKHGVKGELSIEERMACGIGACYSCVCKTKSSEVEGFRYSRVCVEGPVFKASEVIL